jgi:Pregnancy-associated plasma protein-A/Secretion system C-terminal sorting domain/Fibronectin type III domain/Bacterial pre-peptidase C-terminal domain
MNKLFTSILSMTLIGLAMAQTPSRNCASMEVLENQIKADPNLMQRMQQIENLTQQFTNQPAGQNNKISAVVNIPVVIHVVYKSTAENISDAQLQSQIDVLNEDFRKLNSDVSNTPSAFSALAADAEINFCLAKRDPNGSSTTGIVRYSSTRTTSWGTNDAVKIASQGGVAPWDATKYMNIWVCDIGGGILGYAQFPGGSNSTDGIVLDYRYTGRGFSSIAPFNKGRTATHEVGHYLNLRHIWGDANCGNDQVSDTPTQQTSNGGCPSFPHVTCSNGANGDMFMNYMDYTDDACMYMFSTGQKTRMQATLVSGGAHYSLTTSNACTPVSTSSCGTPTGLAASSITTTGSSLSWTAVSGASTYNVRYKTSTATTYTTVTGLTATNTSLSGLTSGVAYNYSVQAVCSGTTGSYATDASFTTTATTTGCTDVYESNESASAAKSITVNAATIAKIGTSTDKDYFKFTTSSGVTNVKVTLTNLTKDFDVKLLSSTGATTYGSGVNGGTTSETIKYNTTTARTYTVYVYGYSSAFDATNCYTLTVSTSSTAFRLGAGSGDEEVFVPKEAIAGLKYIMYPNPAKGDLSIYFDAANEETMGVMIFDMYGRLVKTADQSMAKSTQMKMSLEGLSKGVYMVKVSNGSKVENSRLVIE